MEKPLVVLPNIAMMDNSGNTNNPLSSLVSIFTAKWIGLTRELTLVTSAPSVRCGMELQLIEVRVLGTAVDGEAGWAGDVLYEPGVDTGPVHLGVGGGGLNDDILHLSQRSPQGPELIRNNLGSFFGSFPPSSSIRPSFIENKVRSN